MSHARPHNLVRYAVLLVFVVVPLFLVTSPAAAASRQAKERLARKACLNGDYAKGVEILSDLFVDTKNPTYIFNQGRCLEQNRRYEDAVARFEEYLRVADTTLSSDDRAAADKHIAECKDKLPKDQPDSPLQPTAQPTTYPIPTPTPETPPPDAVVEVPPPPPPPAPPRRRWGLVTAGIITGAVGVAGVTTGIIFNVKANDAAKELETKVGAYPAKSDDEKTFKTVAWIGYGVGAACVATGAVLIAVGAVKTKPKSSTGVALVPALGPDRVGALLTGAF